MSLHFSITIFVSSMNKEKLYPKITLRKREILELIAQGYTDQEISLELHISINTVKTHLKQIYKILDAKNRTQAFNIFKNNKL